MKSLRYPETEELYQREREAGLLKLLSEEPALYEWEYWRLITNRFPYDSIFKTHHMLIPKRDLTEAWQLDPAERHEFNQLLQYFIHPTYHMWFVNCPGRRSMPTLYHVHLGIFKDD